MVVRVWASINEKIWIIRTFHGVYRITWQMHTSMSLMCAVILKAMTLNSPWRYEVWGMSILCWCICSRIPFNLFLYYILIYICIILAVRGFSLQQIFAIQLRSNLVMLKFTIINYYYYYQLLLLFINICIEEWKTTGTRWKDVKSAFATNWLRFKLGFKFYCLNSQDGCNAAWHDMNGITYRMHLKMQKICKTYDNSNNKWIIFRPAAISIIPFHLFANERCTQYSPSNH